MGKVLAIDFGLKRIGLAISDEGRKFAFPRPTLEVKTRLGAIAEIADLCKTEEVSEIVVGQPYALNGKKNEIPELEGFIRLLNEAANLPVARMDERMTSRQAVRELAQAPDRRRGKGSIDRLAAVIILEDYLASHGHD